MHCTIEAVAPGLKPVPDNVRTSPAATFEHTGSAWFELLHVAPVEAGTVMVRLMPGVVVTVPATAVPNNVPPNSTVMTPAVARNFEVNLRCCCTSPPSSSEQPPGAGPVWPRPRKLSLGTACYCTASTAYCVCYWWLAPVQLMTTELVTGSMPAEVMKRAGLDDPKSAWNVPVVLGPASVPRHTVSVTV